SGHSSRCPPFLIRRVQDRSAKSYRPVQQGLRDGERPGPLRARRPGGTLERGMPRGVWGIVGAALAAAMLTGGVADEHTPRWRLGALPFPGPLSLYAAADATDLGMHRYTSWWERPFEEGEGARGIMYTCRAGFLDLAHLRDAVDWTRYLRDHVQRLLSHDG